MHPDPNHKTYDLPNIPVLSPDTDEKGWRTISIGETVKTHYQVYAFYPRPKWRLSAFWTHEGLKHDGKATYREAVSFGNKMKILWPLIKKIAIGIKSGEAFGK